MFTKGGGLWLESIAAIGCDAVGLDWTIDIGEARARVGDKVALQGNLDPAVLFCNPEAIRTEVGKVLPATARAAAMCSTWATAFRSSPSRKMPPPWSRRCMN